MYGYKYFRFKFRVGLGLLNMSIYTKLSLIGVCLGGAEVWFAGYCAGDPGSIPASCVCFKYIKSLCQI